jgi:toluene monooxygenase system ferredoxin subunit
VKSLPLADPVVLEGGTWVSAVALDRLWDGEMVGVHVQGADLLLVNLGSGGIHAYDNRCPHAGTPMSEGHLSGGVLECETHQWQFDAKTGKGLGPRNCTLRKHPVRIVEGTVQVLLAELPARPRA